MAAWSQLYSVTGGSAATLLGLLFVAVSVNASAALGKMHQNSRHLADQAFQNYLVVMLVSLLAIFPSLSISELGYGTLGVAALRGLWALIRLYWAATKPYEAGSRLQSLRQQVSSLAGFALLIYAASRMALGLGDEADGCVRAWRGSYARRSTAAPRAIVQAAASRARPTCSLSSTPEMMTPNRIEVSRKAATTAIGAMVIAHSAKP